MKTIIKTSLILCSFFAMAYIANAQQKLGHLNTSVIFQGMPEVKSADEVFQVFVKMKQSELEQMNAERQKKMVLYQEKFKTMSEANKESVKKELENIATELQDMEKRIIDKQQKSDDEFTYKRTELFQPIIKKVEDIVRVIAKEKGYTYIFDVSQPGLAYFGTEDDLSEEVKQRLNIASKQNAPKINMPANKGQEK